MKHSLSRFGLYPLMGDAASAALRPLLGGAGLGRVDANEFTEIQQR
jgi:hypothetical protein